MSRIPSTLLTAIPVLGMMGYLGLAEGLGTVGRSIYYSLGFLYFLGVISGVYRRNRKRRKSSGAEETNPSVDASTKF